MKNVRRFFNEIINVIIDKDNYHDSTYHPYKCTGNMDHNIYSDCKDEIFYKLSTMVEDARQKYALAILKELESQLANELVDKIERIETVTIHNSQSTAFYQISKEEADRIGAIGEPHIVEISLHEHNNNYIEIDCLMTDLYFFLKEIENIFSMFSIDLKEMVNKHNIEIDDFTENKSRFLQTSLNEYQITLLFQLLMDNEFISNQTIIETFIWVMDGKNGNTIGDKIIWNKNKQLLRELLIPIKHPDIKQADFERLVPVFFRDKKNNPITLAKEKHVPSVDSDKIAEIHKKLATI